MNPIDQMMQAFSASPSPALAGLLGLSQGSALQGPDAENLAAQFANALQTAEAAGDQQALLPGLTVNAVNGAEVGDAISLMSPEEIAQAQQEIFASLGINLPDSEEKPADALLSLLGLQPGQSQSDNSSAPLTAGATLVKFEGLDSATFAELQQSGIPVTNSGVAVVPMSQLEALGLKLEQLPALPSGEELAAVGHTPSALGGRLVQPGELDTLLNQSAQQQSAPSSEASAAAATSTAASQAASQASNQSAADALAASTSASGEPIEGLDTELSVAQPGTKGVAPQQAAPSAQSSTTAAQQSADAATAAQALKAAQDAASEAEEWDDAAQAEKAARAQTEGHAAVVANAQQAAGKKPTGAAPKSNSSGPQSATSTAGDGSKPTLKAGSETLADSMKDTVSPDAVEPAQAKPKPQAAPQPTSMREPQPQMTPERLAGYLDSSSTAALASGLSGMKGESSFMSSMSLMGGRATPELAQQVGQQLNVNVTKAVKAGQNEFTVRLNPAELGRVQVKLSFLEGGRVQAQVMAERPETLEMLQRDTRGFEKAVEAGGGKADGGIQFSLEDKDGESAGKSFAEAMQQEKLREELGGFNGEAGPGFSGIEDDMMQEEIPLEDILSKVTVETGLDVRV